VALFFGDGTITPAISVIASVEGLGSAQPGLKSFVLPVTLTLLTVLFAGQRFGTQALGRLFGPFMALWFAILAASGLAKVIGNPVILKALSPSYGLAFFLDHPLTGFLALGGIVLVVTGAEALYADLGQFDRPSITRAWIVVVFPALIINYLGQGAMILRSPRVSTNLFFEMFPRWAQLPMVVVAVAAAMIASQAVISGAFSVTRQAVQLGFLPRMRIVHKSGAEGQVYVPAVNRLLYFAVVGLVIGFGSAAAMASAYGIAVTGTFATTTILFFVVVRVLWKKPLWIVLPGAAAFLVMDLAFFTAKLTKVVSRRLVPAGARADHLHVALDLAARTGARHGQALGGRGVAARFRRGDPELRSSAAPRAGHSSLPHPGQEDHTARPARQCQLQPRAARQRRHRVGRDRDGPARWPL
jgi:KUP system potassium uptake protein